MSVVRFLGQLLATKTTELNCIYEFENDDFADFDFSNYNDPMNIPENYGNVSELDLIDSDSENNTNTQFDTDINTNTTREDLISDSFFDVVCNNLNLTEYYLKGSVVIVSNKINNELFYQPIYSGSNILVSDLMLYLEFLKSTLKLGELNETIILGLLASILPKPNSLSNWLQNTTQTTYSYTQFIKKETNFAQKASIVKCESCSKGCIAFVGQHENKTTCPICDRPRVTSKKVIILYHEN
jgi:hypothetical protein